MTDLVPWLDSGADSRPELRSTPGCSNEAFDCRFPAVPRTHHHNRPLRRTATCSASMPIGAYIASIATCRSASMALVLLELLFLSFSIIFALSIPFMLALLISFPLPALCLPPSFPFPSLLDFPLESPLPPRSAISSNLS